MRSKLKFNLNAFFVKTTCAAFLTSLSIGALAQTQAAPTAASTLAAPSPALQAPNASTETALANIQKKFIERFGNMPVKNVRPTSFGLFEIQLGNDLIYTDADVNFIFDGHVIDASTRRDLTQARLDELSAVDFKSLPFDLAIKQVRGDGKRQVAIFEDPNCGYCKKLRQNIEGIDNVTVYTFMLPILSDDSRQKVKNVWCAKDRGTTWDNWMLMGITPPKLDCDAPIQKMLDLAKSLQVQGTPAIFFAEGVRVPGAISKEEFEKRLQ
jgi:thiol:disulfide interchange protein DsbC